MPSSLRLLPLFVLALSLCAQNSTKIDTILSELENVHHFADVGISPDGNWISWTESLGAHKDALYLRRRASAQSSAVRINPHQPSIDGEESGLSWSPDSKSFAFVSEMNGEHQILLGTPGRSSELRQLTHLKGDVADLRWSPDGRQLAFLYIPGGGTGGPLSAVPAQTGLVGSGFTNQQLEVISAGDGAMRTVTSADTNIYEYSWSPDQAKFAVIAAPGPADNNWWIARLYSVNVSGGAMKLVYQPPTNQQIAVPRWSPDGTRIAFLGGIMSDEGFLGGDIFAVSSQGGAAKDLTPDIRVSPSGLRWQSTEKIIYTASVDGGGSIAQLDVSSGTSELLWRGSTALHTDGNFPNLSLDASGKSAAVILSDWSQPPEVWSGPLGAWQKVTDANANAQPHWGKAESVLWNSEGLRVQGWLLYPEHYEPAKRYPMVVSIHGGPAGLRSPAWPSVHFDMSALAGLGYFVFFPNARGSYGEGESFTRANVKDFGGGDLRDIMTGVDEVLKRVSVDPLRLGVSGWSYGGYMTMWTVTQTQRFRAAVAGAGIANWLSYYGENSIDEWMIPYFGASVYNDPAVYAKSSPIDFIKQVKTPTLIVVGERDGECPAPQSFEFWHALKTEGVPTELIVYPGEGHSLREAKNRLDVMRRTLSWFDKYLGSN